MHHSRACTHPRATSFLCLPHRWPLLRCLPVSFTCPCPCVRARVCVHSTLLLALLSGLNTDAQIQARSLLIPSVAYHHLPSPPITSHHLPSPPIFTSHLHLPSPPITSHHLPPPPTTLHHPWSPLLACPSRRSLLAWPGRRRHLGALGGRQRQAPPQDAGRDRQGGRHRPALATRRESISGRLRGGGARAGVRRAQ